MKLTFLGTGAADWNGPDARGEYRRLTSTLIDDCLLIDVTHTVDDMIENPAAITDVLFTHSHDDHFDLDALRALAPVRVYAHESWAHEITGEGLTIVPLKIEYGARVSDEFLYASEDAQMDVLSAFADGFAKKVAKGLDLMAFHGINPRTGTASGVISTNHFDSKVTQAVTIASGDKPDTNVEAAIALVQGAERDVTGMVLSPSFKSALAAQTTTDGAKLYPQLAWGAKPGEVNGLHVESTSNLSAGSSLDRALVGDFENCFKWGYAKEIPIEVIQYGNPDNDTELGDLKGHNQVYLRGEAYIGWGILDPTAFAHIKAAK